MKTKFFSKFLFFYNNFEKHFDNLFDPKHRSIFHGSHIELKCWDFQALCLSMVEQKCFPVKQMLLESFSLDCLILKNKCRFSLCFILTPCIFKIFIRKSELYEVSL